MSGKVEELLLAICWGIWEIRNAEVVEGVIEHRVRNQPTRIVWLVVLIRVKRGAIARVDISGALRLAFELIDVDGLDVATMILVEVGEAVVEKNRRLDIIGDCNAQNADICLSGHSGHWPGVIVACTTPSGLFFHLGIEGRRYMLARDFCECFANLEVCGRVGRIRDAVSVVDGDLLDLVWMSACRSYTY